MSANCRSCGAPIIWTVTEAAKRMPVDADPVAGGNLLLCHGHIPIAQVITPDADTLAHVSHFATCPNAAEHRLKTSATPADRHGGPVPTTPARHTPQPSKEDT